MSETSDIYGLYDPRDGQLRYIGKADCAHRRLKTHLRASSVKRATPVYAWIRELREIGLVPSMQILERAADWCEAERRLIRQARAQGDSILNLALGGDQPYCPIEVARANGKKNAGRNAIALHSDAERKSLWRSKRSLGIALKKGWATEETKEKMRYCARKRPELFGEWADIR